MGDYNLPEMPQQWAVELNLTGFRLKAKKQSGKGARATCHGIIKVAAAAARGARVAEAVAHGVRAAARTHRM
jgi:hypothetical protein